MVVVTFTGFANVQVAAPVVAALTKSDAINVPSAIGDGKVALKVMVPEVIRSEFEAPRSDAG